MIVITGAAGFIGSVVAGSLNMYGRDDIVLVDDFSKMNKIENYKNKRYRQLVGREVFFEWLEDNGKNVDFIIHLGASSTGMFSLLLMSTILRRCGPCVLSMGYR